MKCNNLTVLLIGILPLLAMADTSPPPDSVFRVETDLGKGCKITMSLPPSERSRIGNGGDPAAGLGGFRVEPIPKAWKIKSPKKLYFNLTCLDADKVADGDSTVSFDPQTGTWKKDMAKRVKAYGFKMSPQEYQETYEEQDKAIRVYNVTAVNAKGFASTIDDTIGDEEKRDRHMGFCLINKTKALCGDGDVGYVTDGPKGDMTERALEIIRTIEFLDDAPQATDSSAAAISGSGDAK